jgi:integrase
MVCTAAHTGARRSELIRMRVPDVDFVGEVVTVREKKRVRGQLTTRRVPLTKGSCPFSVKSEFPESRGLG